MIFTHLSYGFLPQSCAPELTSHTQCSPKTYLNMLKVAARIISSPKACVIRIGKTIANRNDNGV